MDWVHFGFSRWWIVGCGQVPVRMQGHNENSRGLGFVGLSCGDWREKAVDDFTQFQVKIGLL